MVVSEAFFLLPTDYQDLQIFLKVKVPEFSLFYGPRCGLAPAHALRVNSQLEVSSVELRHEVGKRRFQPGCLLLFLVESEAVYGFTHSDP